MSSSVREIVHQGWLTKSPPTKAIFRPRWRRRWFILKSGSYPNQFVLEYFTDDSCRRHKGTINLDECETIVGPLKVQVGVHDRSRHTFHLRTPSRTYYLAADSEPEMSKWVEGLCQVLGLKMMEDDCDGNTVYAKPSNENNKPNEVEPAESHNHNEDSSPTPSNKSPSGPYIPISECFTGKPIIFNPTNGNEEVTYYNASSFPFPPKVNWATHPYMKDPKDDDGRSYSSAKSSDLLVAPPRPPKKNSSKPTTPTAVASTTTTNVQLKSTGSPRSLDDNQAGHSAGVYENVEENNPDSSSTCSSLHSPPGSAGGGLYCNIPDATENKSAVGGKHQAPTAAPPTLVSSENPVSAIPPKVDRNLKPEVKKANEVNAALKNNHMPSTSNAQAQSQSRQGCMTLPNKSSQKSLGYFQGPEIDRTRKPSDGHLTLSSTPAQIKHQTLMQNNSRTQQTSRMNTSTLPNSTRRRAGPLISPNDKKPTIFHEYETAQELSGTYMQIDCKPTKETEVRSQSLKVPQNKKSSLGGLPPEGSVEYRIIDHVKTKALNQMRLDREKQLQTNTTRH